jgi:hypothetical protein
LLCFLACLLHRGCPLLSCADVFVSDAVPLRARACVFMRCLCVVVPAHLRDSGTRLVRQNKLFATGTLTVAEKMRKQMVKQIVADGLPKPVR